ncbi:MAG TPA: hypothetical protein VN043_17275 [Rhodanobacter sp.]|nr:hypothetical protein [Rhodanobacter sp.]
MDLATLVNIASIISSVAVLISLIYLALQIRQGALNQRAQMDRGRSQQVGEWLQFIAGPDMAPLIFRGHACDPDLSAIERQRYLWGMYPLFLHFEDSYFQHRAGMLGEGQYASILGHLRSQCTTPGFREIWQQIRRRFPSDFVAFVDGLMDEVPGSGMEIHG